MAAHPRVLAGRVFPEPVVSEHVVFRLCHFARRYAGAQDRVSRLNRFDIHVERAQLGRAGFAQHQRAADLRVVAVDARGELGGHQVARLKPPFAGRVHAAHFTPAGTHDHEVLRAALASVERLYVGAYLVLGPPGPGGLHENPITPGRHRGGPSDRIDLERRFVEQQAVDQVGAVGEVPGNSRPGDAVGHQRRGRRGDASVSHRFQPPDRGADDILRPCDGSIGTGDARPIRLRRAVDQDLCLAVDQHDRQRIPLDRREIGGVAQIVAMPGVAVDHDSVESSLGHRRFEPGSAFLVQCVHSIRFPVPRAPCRRPYAAPIGARKPQYRDCRTGRLPSCLRA